MTRAFRTADPLVILDAIEVGVVLHGPDDDIRYVNRRASELLGRNDAVGIGAADPTWDVVGADGEPCPPEARPLALARRSGEPVRDVLLGVQSGGTRTWIMVTAVPLVGADGEIRDVAVSLVDVSARLASEAAAHSKMADALDATERLQASVLRAMAEGVAFHAPSGAIAFANPAAERILGLTIEQMQGREGIDPRWALVAADGSPLPSSEVPSEITAVTGEPTLRHLGVHRASGERAWLTVSTEPVGQPVDGRHAVVATFADVTAERNALRALEEHQALLQDVTETVPGVLVQAEWGPDTARLTYVSPGAKSYLGLAPAELEADPRRALSRMHPLDAARLEAAIRAGATGTATSLDEVVRVGEPTAWRSLRFRAMSRRVGERSIWTGVVLDVTEERRLEDQVRAAQRREAIGTVTSGVAHNFNNTLAVVVPTLEEIVKLVPETHRSMVEDALGAANIAVELVRRLMTVVRGGSQETTELVDVVAVVGDAVSLAQQLFRGTVELATRLEAHGLAVVGSRAELQQLFFNLMLNARDALAGRPHPRIAVSCVRDGDAHVVVSVEDNGCGMSPETLRRVGEPFFTTKAAGRGTGLGLATAAATVRGMGGQLSWTSTDGEGSTFTVRLPTRVAAARAGRSRRDANVDASGARVLVIDDDAAVRCMMIRVLEDRGFSVVGLEKGEEGVRVVRDGATKLDAVLLDLSLGAGQLSGEQTLAALRQLRPDLPVVIVSGFIEDSATLVGAAAFLEKPVAITELVALLQRLTARGS